MSDQHASEIYAATRLRIDGKAVPTSEDFEVLAASRRVIPVVRKLLADTYTPVGLYQRLARSAPGTYLLESAENGRTWSRYSFVGVRCAGLLTEVDGRARWVGDVPSDVAHALEEASARDGDPLSAIRDALELLHSQRIPGLPPLTSGLVGMIGYDAVRRWERLPDLTEDVLQLPEIALLLATDLAVFDHFDGSVLLIANAILPPATECTATDVQQAYAGARQRVDQMVTRLAAPIDDVPLTMTTDVHAASTSDTTPEEYQRKVEQVREHIYAGDAFQVVISQRFSMPTSASALDIYRVLRVSNPSPYMYLMRFPTADSIESAGGGGAAVTDEAGIEIGLGSTVAFDVVGSSPEALVKLNAGHAMLHPIAGSRPRGATPEQDQQFAVDLLADEKERAEHLMLVDLGRNDLGRVSKPGSVEVVEFMEVERFSHIMHIVSTVTAELQPDKTAYDLLAATFPAGTLSGAPKVKAMEIIEHLEDSRRGLYAGCVGYLDFAGDMDTAIAIRTAVLRDGQAYVQAGAGLVADSDPATEQEECEHKAAAVLRAVAIAESIQRVTQ